MLNCCYKSALKDPTDDIWYTSTPIKHYQFTRFMADISKHSRCTKTCTAHSPRSTAIQGMNDSGHEIRHIMHMSGQKNEASVRSYNRDCSTAQKQSLSSSLSSLLIPQSDVISLPESAPTPAPAVAAHHLDSPPQTASLTQNNTPVSIAQSSRFTSTGFLSNSAFNNCVFNFNR